MQDNFTLNTKIENFLIYSRINKPDIEIKISNVLNGNHSDFICKLKDAQKRTKVFQRLFRNKMKETL